MKTTLQFPNASRMRCTASTRPSRRNFLASSGALVLSVGISTVPGARVLAQAATQALSRPRFPAARHLDRHPSRQHRHVLRRQD